jgi:hypothetical protein
LKYSRFKLLFILTNSLLLAEDGTSISGYNQGWLNIGPGIVGGPEVGGFGYGVGISYYPGPYLISGRYLTGLNPSMVEIKEGATHYETMVDVGVCIGAIWKSKWVFSSASAGLGILTGEKRIGIDGVRYREERYVWLSVPLEMQLYLTPLPAFGVGLILLGSINRQSPTLGMMVCLQYGLLR